MQVADCGNGVEAVFEGRKGRGLGEEHEEAVEAFVEEGVAFWFEELETEVWLISKGVGNSAKRG